MIELRLQFALQRRRKAPCPAFDALRARQFWCWFRFGWWWCLAGAAVDGARHWFPAMFGTRQLIFGI